MYSFPNLNPYCCSMSSSNCCFLTCIQISQEADQVGLVFPSLSEFSTVYCDPHTQRLWHSQWSRCFFLQLSCFFDDPVDVGNLISGSSAFLSPAWTSGSSQFTYCWSLAWRILSITLLVCEWSESRSVVSDSLWPHRLYSPWNSPSENTGVGSLSLLQD